MRETFEYFLSTKPAAPWSLSTVGLPAFAIVAILLIFLTIWSYSGHPLSSRRKLFVIVSLRLAALVVALLTALRPSVGYQQEPKTPSTLLIGVDMSKSMTVKDEFGNTSRIDAVRKMLERCQPILDDLKNEQNVNVVIYGFGSPDFAEATNLYDPNAPAAFERSDYRAYLARVLERWQGEQHLRGHVVIGDGADNGTPLAKESGTVETAITEAAKWRSKVSIHTFGTGSKETPSTARDVAILDAILDPNPVPAKTDVKLRLRVNAYGFVNANVPMKVQFDTGAGYKDVLIEKHRLLKERDNIIEINLKAPELSEGKKSMEVKVRAEIPTADLPGDINPQNNIIESYFTVTKDGLRVLVVDRLRFEYAFLLDALAADQRIDVRKIDLQTQEGGASVAQAFDFELNAYDVLILGNVTAAQIEAVDPKLPEKIANQVLKKGMGFMMIGGHATFMGNPNLDSQATGWAGTKPIEDILPVKLDKSPANVPATEYVAPAGQRFQVIVNPRFADSYLMKIANTRQESEELWFKLNDDRTLRVRSPRSRFSSISNIGTPKTTADVIAYASHSSDILKPAPNMALPPLLVAHQIGDGNRGRVIAFAAQDTYLWQRLGQPENDEGRKIHERFWRQLVLWLAHQETEEDTAFARPEFPRVPVGRKQKIRIGIKGKNGAKVIDPVFELKVLAPGENEAAAKALPVKIDENGEPIVTYDPTQPGEHLVKLVASGKTGSGEEVKGEASAKFLSYAEATDEMIRTAADFDQLQKIAAASGGRFHRLDYLPTYLKELKGTPIIDKPKPRYYPDWRRNHSQGFLPIWLVIFALLLGAEWALRRMWGMM